MKPTPTTPDTPPPPATTTDPASPPPDPPGWVYVVTVEDDDSYDGVVVDSTFLCREDAERAAEELEGRSISGAEVESVAVRLYPSFDAWQAFNTPDLRKSALAKLTAAEKRALGLSEEE